MLVYKWAGQSDFINIFISAHKRVNYNHLNTNPKISGKKDLHLPISGCLEAGGGVSKACTAVNSVNRVILK